MKPTANMPPAPEHLSPVMADFWRKTLETYALEEQQFRILQLACEAYDRARWAAESIEANGAVFVDRFNQPKARPECNIARDNAALFARLCRELCLDIEVPETRLPRPAGRYR